MESSTKSSQEKSTESTTATGQELKPATMVDNSEKVDREAALNPPKVEVQKKDEPEKDHDDELEAEDSESKTFGSDGQVKSKKSIVKKKKS